MGGNQDSSGDSRLDRVACERLARWLETYIVPRMNAEVPALYRPPREPGGKGAYVPRSNEPVLPHDLIRHISGEQPLGLFVMSKKLDGYVRCAVLDLDDKKGDLGWDELRSQALNLAEELEARLLLPWACRSGGGNGLHLWLLWAEPQPAAAVRVELKAALQAAKVTCHVDIFPAQDELRGGLGNLVALPLARASRPMLLPSGEVVEDLLSWNPDQPALSAPIIKGPRPGQVTLTAGSATGLPVADVGWEQQLDLSGDAGLGVGPQEDYGAPDPALLREAMSYINADDYGTWLRVGLALRVAVLKGHLEDTLAYNLWTEWSQRSEKFNPRAQVYNWHRFRPRVDGAVTLGTVWWLARESGWKPDKADLLPEPTHAELVEHDEPADRPAVSTPHLEEVAPEVERPNGPGPAQRRAVGGNPLGEDPALPAELRWRRGGGGKEVTDLNKFHFVAFEGNKLYVFREDWDPVLKRHRLVRMNLGDFKSYHANNKVVAATTRQGRPIYRELGDLWLDSPHRRQYRDLVMCPEGAPEHSYNLWRGWAIEPAAAGAGGWDRLKDHILKNVCNSDAGLFEYVIRWCALAIQRPEQAAGVALVLRGDRGNGKGTFARALGRLFGQHFLHVTNTRALTGNFNSHLRDSVLVFADEAVWAGNRSEESVLKGLITEPTIQIEGKGRDAVTSRNMAHVIIATNHDWAVPAGIDERRFCVIDVANWHKQDTAYFRAIDDELEAGGHAALLRDLLTIDLAGFDVYRVPVTGALVEQKLLSLDTWAAWWLECLTRGWCYPGQRDWFTADLDLAYGNYVEHARDAGGRSYTGTRASLVKMLKKVMPPSYDLRVKAGRGTRTVYNDTGMAVTAEIRTSNLELPDLRTCRLTFIRLLGTDPDTWYWPDDGSNAADGPRRRDTKALPSGRVEPVADTEELDF